MLSLQITVYKDRRHMRGITRDLQVCRNDGETLADYSDDFAADPESARAMTMYD